MPRKKSQAPDPVFPTPMEAHEGKIIDPRGHEEKIEQAVATLSNFAQDMDEGRIPQSTLEQVHEAVGTLGYFAGYPADAHHLELYLESTYAQSSYSHVARLVGPYAEDMAKRVRQRIAMLNLPAAESTNTESSEDEDKEIPF